MYKYIMAALESLEWMDLGSAKAYTPICSPIEGGDLIIGRDRRKFMTAVGMLGWLVNTGRPDVAYAHSRIAQHMASPTTAAMAAVKRCFKYLKRTAHYTLSVPLHDEDRHAAVPTDPYTLQDGDWEFYCDSDFAGNNEPQNKRRSQNGYIAISGGAPVYWASKVSSVAFAHPDIGEAHVDVSSGAAEVYACLLYTSPSPRDS